MTDFEKTYQNYNPRAAALAEARAFIKEVGYPVIVKPDNGCGTEATYKLRNFTELKEFYAEPHNVRYIMEEYINGTIVSFDGVADSHCVPLFYTSNVFPTPLLDIVSQNGDLSYWTQKSVPAALKDVASAPSSVRRKEPLLPLRVFPVE